MPRKIVVYRMVDCIDEDAEKLRGEIGLAISTVRLAVSAVPNPFFKADSYPLLTYIICESIKDQHTHYYSYDQMSKGLQGTKRGTAVQPDKKKPESHLCLSKPLINLSPQAGTNPRRQTN